IRTTTPNPYSDNDPEPTFGKRPRTHIRKTTPNPHSENDPDPHSENVGAGFSRLGGTAPTTLHRRGRLQAARVLIVACRDSVLRCDPPTVRRALASSRRRTASCRRRRSCPWAPRAR